MKFIFRAISSIGIVGVFIFPLLFSCNDSGKKDNTALLLPLLLGQCREPVSGENKIYIFSNSVTHNGNLGGRAGADSTCITTASTHSVLSLKTVQALLTESSLDVAANLVPAGSRSWPVYALSDNCESMIKESWLSLWEYPQHIDEALQDAAGLRGSWWSGSDRSGGNSIDKTCNGWTSDSESIFGEAGSNFYIDLRWIENTSPACNLLLHTLCVAC